MRRIPTLVLYGALDNAQGHHAPIVAELIEHQKLSHIELRIIPGVGHTMGPEKEGRVGPVDERILDVIITWLDEHFAVQ